MIKPENCFYRGCFAFINFFTNIEESKILKKLLRSFIEKPYYSFDEVLRMQEDLNLQQLDISNYPPEIVKMCLEAYLRLHVNMQFAEIFTISQNFEIFLSNNDFYSIYFSFLKRFLLLFFRRKGFSGVEGKCKYEPDPGEMENYYPKIEIYLPNRDYDEILDILEIFIEIQELYFRKRFINTRYFEPIKNQFKKTKFLFDKLI